MILRTESTVRRAASECWNVFSQNRDDNERKVFFYAFCFHSIHARNVMQVGEELEEDRKRFLFESAVRSFSKAFDELWETLTSQLRWNLSHFNRNLINQRAASPKPHSNQQHESSVTSQIWVERKKKKPSPCCLDGRWKLRQFRCGCARTIYRNLSLPSFFAMLL